VEKRIPTVEIWRRWGIVDKCRSPLHHRRTDGGVTIHRSPVRKGAELIVGGH